VASKHPGRRLAESSDPVWRTIPGCGSPGQRTTPRWRDPSCLLQPRLRRQQELVLVWAPSRCRTEATWRLKTTPSRPMPTWPGCGLASLVQRRERRDIPACGTRRRRPRRGGRWTRKRWRRLGPGVRGQRAGFAPLAGTPFAGGWIRTSWTRTTPAEARSTLRWATWTGILEKS